jgi:PPOX class probable F420-dependent enzyme
MKPKRTGAMGLKRVRNILANPQVAVVIDHYEEDWGQLWYLLVRGRGEILQSGAEHDRAIKHLRDKYPQYRAMELGGRPLIKITPTTMVSWRGAAD